MVKPKRDPWTQMQWEHRDVFFQGKTREGYVAKGYGGGYEITLWSDPFAPKEPPRWLPRFGASHICPDPVLQRHFANGHSCKTPEEAQAWCQGFEDAYWS